MLLYHKYTFWVIIGDKVRDTKMMMNAVRNSIYYLLYVS